MQRICFQHKENFEFQKNLASLLLDIIIYFKKLSQVALNYQLHLFHLCIYSYLSMLMHNIWDMTQSLCERVQLLRMVQNFNTFNLSQKHKPFYGSYCIVLVFVYAVTTMKRSLMNTNMKAVFSGDVKC